jgi:ferrochelatase
LKKLAVVLLNLGGPDRPEAVRPFLFNLFRDPAIIGLPAIARYPLAALMAFAEAIRDTWERAGKPSNIRLLFSAHGLPQKIVDAGDPYRAQVEATAAAIADRIPELADWRISFQSRVGPLKWLEPATDAEVRRAGADGKGVLIAPIAFVSEHVETLVELDHEYAHLARQVGAAPYLRSPTPGVRQSFIDELARAALGGGGGTNPYGPWLCPAGFAQCACRRGETA